MYEVVRERSAKRDIWHLQLPNNRINWTTQNATLALQQMEVLCYNGLSMGTQRFSWKSQFCLYFVNKIYLPCCCVVFFVFLPSQAALTRFRRVIVLWIYRRIKEQRECDIYLATLGVRHSQTADLQTCRPADLQTCS